MSRDLRTLIVTFESTSRTTAAGNHIEAVRRAFESDGIDVAVVGDARPRPLQRWLVVLAGSSRHMWRRRVVYVRNHPVAILVVVCAWLLRRNVVLEVNGPPDDIAGTRPGLSLLARPLRWSMALTVKMSDAIVVPTDGLKRYAEQWSNVPTAVIPAGYDESIFNPGAAASSDLDHLTAVFVGADTNWQGLDIMLAAVDHDDWPEAVRLVLVGEFASVPPHPRVLTTGRLPPREVAAHVANALVALSPKTYRGGRNAQTGQAPLKVFEAMGCGTPCIVTSVPTQDEIITESGSGMVIAPDDAPALARAVAAYAIDPELRAAHSRQASVGAKRFSWTALGTDTVDFVRAVDEAR
jgi:glycosyltransferase involved in cell wall biosynthesis